MSWACKSTYVIICLFLLLSCKDDDKYDSITVKIGPPFTGSAYFDADIITKFDPSSYESITPLGQGMREMYDRRGAKWVTVNAYLFKADYDDGLSIEVQVNPEFGSTELAEIHAEKYAIAIGRIPKTLRLGVQTVWIHRGYELFGGGNNNILIHTDQAERDEANGYLEEILVHEGAHSSLDDVHATSDGWIKAQGLDPTFISTYARDNPTREDLAETILPYLAITYRSNRISSDVKEQILRAIPNRIQYLDNLAWNLHPWN